MHGDKHGSTFRKHAAETHILSNGEVMVVAQRVPGNTYRADVAF
jgi:hypothetical protein